MRLPNRKLGKYTFTQFDPKITKAKLQILQKKLAQAKAALPQAIKETQQYGENGDFSENAEYQIAKGRLRALNRAIEELQYQINHAEMIAAPAGNTTVQIGHTVTIRNNNREQTFQILGSSETNPKAGIISYQSPLGSVLLGHLIGDTVKLKMANTAQEYIIVAII
ncbi:MAG: hypothetical protein ACD_43C00143G0003 [uncultured bacterium]|nr:MAG: hypothetical protein ACD_43C00143G0003 [uncultured bacterium]